MFSFVLRAVSWPTVLAITAMFGRRYLRCQTFLGGLYVFSRRGDTFTSRLRDLILAAYRGKRITFRTRFGTHKTKKVSGVLVYVSHKPDVGFRLHLTRVRHRGMFLPFVTIWLCRDIIWSDQYFFLEAYLKTKLLAPPEKEIHDAVS
jgi:hypothetical protein